MTNDELLEESGLATRSAFTHLTRVREILEAPGTPERAELKKCAGYLASTQKACHEVELHLAALLKRSAVPQRGTEKEEVEA